MTPALATFLTGGALLGSALALQAQHRTASLLLLALGLLGMVTGLWLGRRA